MLPFSNYHVFLVGSATNINRLIVFFFESLKSAYGC